MKKYKDYLAREDSEHKLKHLAEIGETRWGSVKKTFDTLLASWEIIEDLIGSRLFKNWKEKHKAAYLIIEDFFADRETKEMLEKGVLLAAPLDSLITKFQGSKQPLSEVYHEFTILSDKYSATNMPCLATAEITFIQREIKHYWDFLCDDAHSIAYMLDMRYGGGGMLEDYLVEVMHHLCEFPISGTQKLTQMDPVYIARQAQFIGFKAFVSANQDLIEGETGNRMYNLGLTLPPYTFWDTMGGKWPALKPIALRVFSLLASSALAETSFSGMAFIHNRYRNRLSVEKVEKLQYIRTNKGIFANDSGYYDDDLHL